MSIAANHTDNNAATSKATHLLTGPEDLSNFQPVGEATGRSTRGTVLQSCNSLADRQIYGGLNAMPEKSFEEALGDLLEEYDATDRDVLISALELAVTALQAEDTAE